MGIIVEVSGIGQFGSRFAELFVAGLHVPGIVAHDSSARDGELHLIPDFGVPPEDIDYLDPLSRLR